MKSGRTLGLICIKRLTDSPLTLLPGCISPLSPYEDGENATWGRFIFVCPSTVWERIRNAILHPFCRGGGLKWLDHMLSPVLICSSGRWNGAHLVLVHLKPLWTSRSGPAVRRHDAATLIYCWEVSLCLRIKRQLNYGGSESLARAVGDGWGERTGTERRERWEDRDA